MTPHSIFSPSKRFRWSRCPGSVKLNETIEQPITESALEGTRLHKDLENSLINLTNSEDPSVQFALDYVRGKKSKTVLNEVRVKSTFDGIESFGTIDIVLVSDDDSIEIIDFKTGMAPVEAFGNHQLEMYAVMLADSANMNCRSLQLTIVQPTMSMVGKYPIKSTYVTGPFELIKWKSQITSEIKDVISNPDKTVSGPNQCKYCLAQSICPSFQKIMDKVM